MKGLLSVLLFANISCNLDTKDKIKPTKLEILADSYIGDNYHEVKVKADDFELCLYDADGDKIDMIWYENCDCFLDIYQRGKTLYIDGYNLEKEDLTLKIFWDEPSKCYETGLQDYDL